MEQKTEAIDYNLMTNKELHENLARTTEGFFEAQKRLRESYDDMVDFATESTKITEILKKRGEKLTDEECC